MTDEAREGVAAGDRKPDGSKRARDEFDMTASFLIEEHIRIYDQMVHHPDCIKDAIARELRSVADGNLKGTVNDHALREDILSFQIQALVDHVECLTKALQDCLDCLDKTEVSPSFVIGACQRARRVLASSKATASRL